MQYHFFTSSLSHRKSEGTTETVASLIDIITRNCYFYLMKSFPLGVVFFLSETNDSLQHIYSSAEAAVVVLLRPPL